MKLTIDTADRSLLVDEHGQQRRLSLDTPEAFALLSRQWVQVGWTQKYSFTFTWMGRPIIQLPEDLVRIQELLFTVKPDVIVETGVAHGGSLIFYSSLCKIFNKGRVVGIDVEIRKHNRAAIDSHPLADRITLVEGSSTDPEVVNRVGRLVQPGETVMVMLDSNHTKAHVLGELNAYAPLVSKGSYVIVMDGVMQELAGFPRAHADWTWDNPVEAVKEFLAGNPDFVLDEPAFLFNESLIRERYTYWPSGFLKRVR
jgi:cephalosporin hydroxylase